jgi:hypothetical protein
MPKLKDLTGQVYGDLTVVKQGKNIRTHAAWVCKCTCGKQRLVRSDYLQRGKTKNCGSRCPLLKGSYAQTCLYHVYKYTCAKSRGLEFTLTREQFSKLISKPCHYCGCQPNQKFSTPTKTDYCKYNGLDRLNNKLGYTLRNVVPCCLQCNRSKCTLSVGEFFSWLKQVYEYSNVNEDQIKSKC